jgi:peptide/nickel transport system permease protein
MLAYLIRRIGYGFLVVLGVLLFLYALFFLVTSPDDIARRALGDKAMPAVIAQWKKNHGYDRPLYPKAGAWTDNLLVDHFRRMLTFDFGRSDADDSPIADRLLSGAKPSLLLTTPAFLIGLVLAIGLSLIVTLFRESYIDELSLILGVLGMSIPSLLYIIGGQFVLGKLLRWFPVSGFDANPVIVARFLALPVIVGVVGGLGRGVRFYRTVFIEEINKDYVRTAWAKGCGEGRVMSRHVLRNTLIPILTDVVMEIPFLFMGALLTEAFFGIPGLGSLTVDAIFGNDFSVLRTMVYIGALLFILGQIVTDVSYTLVDPRIRFD